MNDNTNWRDLPAGRELDRVIAARLGYYVVKATMYSPKGTLLGGDYRIHSGAAPETPEAIAQCWEFYGPRFSTDANAALTLWDDDFRWTLYPSYDQPGFTATYPMSGDQSAGEEHADTPAFAVCRAKLAWWDWLVALK